MNRTTWAILTIPITLASSARAEVVALYTAPGLAPEKAIVEAFDKATKSIEYQMYSFTAKAVGDALLRAHDRGVKVTILLDADAASSQYSQAGRLAAAGLKVMIDDCKPVEPIAHNKVRIVDRRLALVGSYNDSEQAKKNAEELYAIDTPWFVRDLGKEFEKHLAEAIPYKTFRQRLEAKEAAKALRLK